MRFDIKRCAADIVTLVGLFGVVYGVHHGIHPAWQGLLACVFLTGLELQRFTRLGG